MSDINKSSLCFSQGPTGWEMTSCQSSDATRYVKPTNVDALDCSSTGPFGSVILVCEIPTETKKYCDAYTSDKSPEKLVKLTRFDGQPGFLCFKTTVLEELKKRYQLE